MEFVILLGLIVLNGVFAMSEMALVSSRKAYLKERAEKGEAGAKEALKLLEEPNRFFSTVQVGITLIGIIAGAFGGSTIAQEIGAFVANSIPALAPYSPEIGFAVIVTITTYLSLVVGELVPKRIALNNPEAVATFMSPPMSLLSRIAAPLVWLLSKSTELLSRLLGVQGADEQFITDFEVLALMREGIQSGEFNPQEHEMVKGALELDDTRVREIITPRTEMRWLDLSDSRNGILEKIKADNFEMYPVSDGELDDVLGLVFTKDVLLQLLSESQPNLRALLHEALYVPETAIASNVLQQLKQRIVTMALVVGEYGGIEGMVSQNDILAEIVGDLSVEDPDSIQRKDGSWLVDGQYSIGDMTELIADFEIPEEETGDYNTLAGFVLKRLGRIPRASDNFEWKGYHFEVIDMDGKRIDKVLIIPKTDSA